MMLPLPYYRLFIPRSLLSVVMLLLLAGLLVLVNIFFLMYTSVRLGAYLSLAGAGLISLFSTAIFWSSVRRYMVRVRTLARSCLNPRLAYIHLAGLMMSLLFIVIPGPLTAVVAWLLYLPPLRLSLGALIYRRYRSAFTVIHEDVQTEFR
jgi:UPF0716 family protein affecting phage T7 exclusion